jgi:hypothetical protein
MKPMTMRQRLRAVIRGEPHDRVPFIQYDGLLPNAEVWNILGQNRMGLLRWCWPHRAEPHHTRFEETPIEKDGRRGLRITLHTPKGNLTCEKFYEPVYNSAATAKHFVQDIQDYDIVDAYLEDSAIVFDPSSYRKALKELGENGLPLLAVDRTAWQQLWVQWVGIEDLSYHFAEHEDRLMRTVGLLEKRERAIMDCACKMCPEFVDIPDNITASMIGPEKFQRFCIPIYRELSERLAETGALAFCHMDGNLKPLWDKIGQSGLGGLDSMSPPPDNDTSVGEAHAMWPNMRICINFPSSVHLMAPERIRKHTREILSQGGNTGRLSIDLSENVPPTVWRTSLPVIADEIEDFGTPALYR